MANSPGGVEVGRVSVRVLPDTSRIFEEMRSELSRIERELSLDITASVNATELTASAESAVAQAQAAAGDIDIKANVDTSQVSQAEGVLKNATSASSGLLGSFSALGAGASVLGLALIPLTAVIGGLVLALAAPLAISAGGATVFGLLAGFAVKDTLKQLKAIDKVDGELSSLTKGTQEYRDKLAELQVLQGGLTPAQKSFADALDKVKDAFSNIPSGVLLKPLTAALDLLADLLPKLTPVIKAVSDVFSDLVGSLDDAVKSPGFKQFIKTFAHDAGRDLRAFASIIGNVISGLSGLFFALDGSLSGGVLKGLEDITQRFADFGQDAKHNEGLKAFVDYVKQNMPKVGQFVSNSFALIGAAFETLAPFGSAVLDLLNGITGALRDLGPLAGPVAAALGGLALGTALGGPQTGLIVAAVVALAAGFKALYDRSKPLQKIIRDLGDYFKDTWLPLIQHAAQDVVPAFKDAFKDISDTIRDNKGLFEVLGKALIALTSASVIATIEQLAAGIRIFGKAFKVGTAAVKFFADVTLTSFQVILKGIQAVVGAVLGQFGTIVDAQAAAFGWIPKVGGRIKDAQAKFHEFADGVTGNLDAVGDTLSDLKTQIDVVGNSHPRFQIDSNTLAEIAHMHELQRLQIADKHFKITADVEQAIERTVGPGGGRGRPGDLGSGSGNGAAGRTPSPVNIEKGFFTDTNDVLRKSDRRSRARANGGVQFPAPRVPEFAGA